MRSTVRARDVVVGYDMRDSSPGFAAAFRGQCQARGGNVLSIGLCSTDETTSPPDASTPRRQCSPPVQSGHLQRHQVQSRRRSGHQFRRTGLKAIRDRAQAYLAGSIEPVAEPAPSARSM
jgi:phosphomannomutase